MTIDPNLLILLILEIIREFRAASLPDAGMVPMPFDDLPAADRKVMADGLRQVADRLMPDGD